ncbi:MAG: type II secretion system GspH family protein, partial [Candidatus Peregrinibacteria bacterium]|nr:type II secretion system GspH family protein [Candidatus Peregrinibacteria bacterium]
MSLNKKKAFTLMEIIVAIAIMGMMASLISPSYLAYRRNAQLKLAAQSLQTAFGEAFSLARSSNETFCVTNISSEMGSVDRFSILKGSGCNDGVYEETIFESGVEIVEPERFNIIFSSPYGDIDFQQNGANDFLDIKIKNTMGVSKTVKIYQK